MNKKQNQQAGIDKLKEGGTGPEVIRQSGTHDLTRPASFLPSAARAKKSAPQFLLTISISLKYKTQTFHFEKFVFCNAHILCVLTEIAAQKRSQFAATCLTSSIILARFPGSSPSISSTLSSSAICLQTTIPRSMS